MKNNIKGKCKQVKVVLSDVDGVLTNGGMYYTDKGDVMKRFHVRDGMGVTLLKKNNIPTVLVTKEKTRIVKQWAKNMNIEKLYDGIIHKESILNEICKHYKIKTKNIAYIGDDVNDLDLLKKVGLSATPSDGIAKAKKICHYVCKVNGGDGAFREFADLIIQNQIRR